jgi:hypothetical protein
MFEFRARHAVHEGNTKYYQVISVTNTVTGDGVVVTHWGSWTSGASREPKLHGKATKVDTFVRHSAQSAASSTVRAKSKRGYSSWDEIRKDVDTIEDLRKLLDAWFKSADANLIEAHLTHWMDIADLVSVDEVDYEDDPEADAKRAAELAAIQQSELNEAMQNKNWGIW